MGKLQTNAVRAAAAVSVAVLLYRGVTLYLRNDITITVTELVRFPTIYIHNANHQKKNNNNNNNNNNNYPNVVIKGKISMVNCTMRSYRFLLKLTGKLSLQNMNNNLLSPNYYTNHNNQNTNNNNQSNNSRVTNSFPSSARESDVFYDNNNNNNNLMLTSSGSPTANNSNYSSFLSPRNNNNSNVNNSTKVHLAVCEPIHEMIDYYDMLQHQNIAFTPACISEETLFFYTTTTNQTNNNNNNNNNFNPAVPSIRLQQVDLAAHSSAANAVCLSFYVLFYEPLQNVTLNIKLPSHYEKLIGVHTSELGYCTLPAKKKNPYVAYYYDYVGSSGGSYPYASSAPASSVSSKRNNNNNSNKNNNNNDENILSWHIDAVDGNTYKKVQNESLNEEEDAVLIASALQVGGANNTDDNSNNKSVVPILKVRFHVIYTVNHENNFASTSSKSTGTNPNTNIQSARNNNNNNNNNEDDEYDEYEHSYNYNNNIGYESEEGDVIQIDATGAHSGRGGGVDNSVENAFMINNDDFFLNTNSRGTSPSKFARSNSNNNNLNNNASSAASSSNKAKKRAERARKKEQQKQKNNNNNNYYENAMVDAKGISKRSSTFPLIEIMYSRVGLASAMAVKKLQVVKDTPNWVARPKSILDKYILPYVVPYLCERKLQRFALYSSWYVQTVVVTSSD